MSNGVSCGRQALIGVVDYGLGNTQAFANTYRRMGIESYSQFTIDFCIVILPGVGSFDWAMRCLQKSGLCLDKEVLEVKTRPRCLRWNANNSSISEEGIASGLGWIDANVVSSMTRYQQDATSIWDGMMSSQLQKILFGGKSSILFLAFVLHGSRKTRSYLSHISLGVEFASAIRRDNVFGTQFHPEKSHEWVQTIKKFC